MILRRIVARYRRTASRRFAVRSAVMRNAIPLISFTFDDFPRSALYEAGSVLSQNNVHGTFYTSIGLAGREEPSGTMFALPDLKEALVQGHELGCHTFHHCHATRTEPKVFEESVFTNAKELLKILPEATFKTLSYPIGSPLPATKRLCSRHFSACRGGGQTYNRDQIDLNLLRSFFIEQARDKLDVVEGLIEENSRRNGWLIFSTHDVSASPTDYGCTPIQFRSVLEMALASGALILPVSNALELVLGATSRPLRSYVSPPKPGRQ